MGASSKVFPPHAQRVFFEALGVFILTGAFYLYTCSPTIGFGDTALLVDAIQKGPLSSHVNYHPFTVLCGRISSALFSGDLAFRANLVSVFFGSATVATLFLIWRLSHVDFLTGVFLAASIAVTYSLWWHSTVIENYAGSAFLIAGTHLFLMLAARTKKHIFLGLASAVAGFSLFNHVQNGFLCIAVGVFALVYGMQNKKTITSLAVSLFLGIFGAVPWIYLIVRDSIRIKSFQEALNEALFGKFAGTFFSAPFSQALTESVALFWYQSPSCIPQILACIGIFSLLKEKRMLPWSVALVIHFGITSIVFSSYDTWDRFAFLLASYISLFAVIGIGAEKVIQKKYGAVLVSVLAVVAAITSLRTYALATSWSNVPNGSWFSRYSNRHSENLYDQASFIANPDKRNFYEMREFSDHLGRALPEGAMYLDDDSRTYYTIADYYQRYQHWRPDVSVLLMNSWGFLDWGKTSSELEELAYKAYHLQKPFFVASLHSPYVEFIKKISQRIPVRFEEFKISDSRWIYQLVPLSPYGSKIEDRNKFIAGHGVLPVSLIGASGEIDLTSQNILFSISTGLIVQEMAAFGIDWTMNNQLFLGAGNPGAYIEFFVLPGESKDYALSLGITTGPDFGNVEVRVDRKIVGTFEMFSETVQKRIIDLGTLSLEKEGAVLSLRVIDRQVKSSGYNLGIDGLQFVEKPFVRE